MDLALMPAFGSPTGSGFAMRSLRFNSADSAALSRTPGSAGNRKLVAFRCHMKRVAFGSLQVIASAGTASIDRFYFDSSDRLCLDVLGVARLVSTAVFRDPSAWVDILDVGFFLDVANGTAALRAGILVGGSEIPSYSTDGRASIANSDTNWNNTVVHYIGRDNAGNYLRAYLADCVGADGSTSITNSQVNVTTGQRTAVATPTFTPGTNGFWLSFNDNSNTTSGTLGADDAGGSRGAKTGSNDWTPTNFSVAAGAGNDSLFDTPINYDDGVNGRGNFCTLNPLHSPAWAALPTITNGNLDHSGTITQVSFGSFGITSGKWYWEVLCNGGAGVGGAQIGIANAPLGTISSNGPGQSANAWTYNANGQKGNNNSFVAYGASFTTNDVIGVALDADAGTLTFYKNGTTQGQAYSGLTSGPYFPIIGGGGSSNTVLYVCNFGQRALGSTPPSGHKALCTQNLPELTIIKPNQYFDAVAYNLGGVGGNITSLNFQPDFVWIKSRGNGTGHRLVDAVRGVTKSLESNSTGAEATEATGLTAFLSNGFTLGTDADYNPNAAQVAWCWKEGSLPGFDIVAYTGNGTTQTVNHSLGVTPNLIIVKGKTAGRSWLVGGSMLDTSSPWGYYLFLEQTAARSSVGNINTWGNNSVVVAPTSSVFTVGSGLNVNENGVAFIAYLFAEVLGFSRFGSYTGNGNADGPFVWCGFRPRFIMIKVSSTTGNWFIYDTARDPFNVAPDRLYPNLADAEGVTSGLDIVSNGFKLRTITTDPNAAQTYIFAAFAEAPFKYARAR